MQLPIQVVTGPSVDQRIQRDNHSTPPLRSIFTFVLLACFLCWLRDVVRSTRGTERSSEADDVIRRLRRDWSVRHAYLC